MEYSGMTKDCLTAVRADGRGQQELRLGKYLGALNATSSSLGKESHLLSLRKELHLSHSRVGRLPASCVTMVQPINTCPSRK